MAELRIAQLARGAATSSSYVTVYTVPAGRRVILKNLNLRNQSGAASNVQVNTTGVADLLAFPLTAGGTVGGNASIDMWVVLNAGDTIRIAVSSGTTVSFVFSGTNHFV
jgi:hypothetical protein